MNISDLGVHCNFDFLSESSVCEVLNTCVDEKSECLEETIAMIDQKIQSHQIHGFEDQRLITIANRVKSQLEAYRLRLPAEELPACCFYRGDNYLVNVVALAEKQARVKDALTMLKFTPGIDPNVHAYFERVWAKLHQGINVALPDYFHATSAGLGGIIQDHMIRQSANGRAGAGTYMSCNDEGNLGYGPHTFVLDESCLVGTSAIFFTGRKPNENVFYSLWAAVHKDIPINEQTVAFIDTLNADDVRAKLQAEGLDIEVVDRSTAEGIHKIFDLATRRRELPSFDWKKQQLLDYLPQNMYPRSVNGTFRNYFQ